MRPDGLFRYGVTTGSQFQGRSVNIAVFSPHRDDAAFSLGLSVEAWLRAGHNVRVLNCFTQSEYAPYSDVGSLHANDRRSFVSAVRKREDVAWNKLLGGGVRWTDLDLLDAPLRLACAVDEVLTVPVRPGDRAQARVAGAVAKLARAAETEKIAILLPLAVGNHIDHRIVRDAGLQMLLNAAQPVAFYEDLPYASWPGGLEDVAANAERTGFGLQPVFPAEAAPDGKDVVERKRRMVESYDSQIDSGTALQIAAFSAPYGGRERLWANAAWRNAELYAPEQGEAEA